MFGLVWAADAMQVLAVGFTGATIAKTFGLTVPQALQTGTLFFLGMLIGAAVFGRLADKYGRRRVLLITVACDAVFGLLSAFAPSFGILLFLRFMTGVAVGGTLPVDYAMMAEFLPAKIAAAGLSCWRVLGSRHSHHRPCRLGHQPCRRRGCVALYLHRHRSTGSYRHLAAPLGAGIPDASLEVGTLGRSKISDEPRASPQWQAGTAAEGPAKRP